MFGLKNLENRILYTNKLQIIWEYIFFLSNTELFRMFNFFFFILDGGKKIVGSISTDTSF